MSTKTFFFMLCALLLSAAAACGDDSGSDGASGQSGGDGDGDGDECDDAPTYDEVTAFDKCTMCHSSELSGGARNNAPDDHDFDTFEGAAEHADHIAEEAEEGEMPPPASGITITPAERAALIKWATCGTPE